MAYCLKYCVKFLLFIFLIPTYFYGQTPILLDDLTKLHLVGEQVSFLEDATNKLSIEDISNKKLTTKFAINTQEAINFSSTASAYWLKFHVTKLKEGNFYLNVGSAYIDEISLYEYDSNEKLISSRHTGDDLPFNSREIEVGNYLFALNYDVGATRTFYMKVKSDQPLFFPIRVGTLSNFVAYEHDLDFIQGIYFGFMLLIFLYSLFLFISTQDKVYLYYIFYVFSMTWFMASVFGYFFEYFWPNTPFINQVVVFSSGLTMITASLFTQKFLNTKKHSPLMHKGSKVFILMGFLVCLLVLIDYKIEGLKLAQGGLLIMALYFLILGVRFLIKGFRPAKFYLIAWGALILGIFFAILESLNLVPVMNYLNAMQIGSATEVLFLSFALGDRINMYKKQKEDAQAMAVYTAKENQRLIMEQNNILENMVIDRTTELDDRNKELVNLNEEKDMLVNIVAHDLRTPLGQIKGFVQLLKMSTTDFTEEDESFLNEIDNSADRLTQMTGRILNIHDLETKQIKLTNKIIDLVKLVEYVEQSFHFTSSKKDIEIIIEAEEGDHFIEVDRNYMIQVIENLLSNAIKFSIKSSEVIMRVKTSNKITILEIEDFGPGISEKDQLKLFKKFQKLSAQPTDGESSTGLGLSIAKKYIDAMNGKIQCESELNKGTKFIVSFPNQEVTQ